MTRKDGEQLWKTHRRSFLVRRVRIAAAFGALGNLSVFVFDALMSPDLKNSLLTARLLQEVGMFAVLAATFLPVGKRYPQVLAVSLAAAASMPMVLIQQTLGATPITYFASYPLGIFGVGVLLPVSLGMHIGIQLIFLVFHALLPAWAAGTLTPDVLIFHAYLFTFTCLLTDTAVVLQERLHKRNFLSELELREANHRLQEESRNRADFFASVSHEIRTPLTLVIGNLHLLERYIAPQAKERRPLDTALRNGDRLLGLINELLDLERLESTGMLRKRPTDVAGLVVEAAANFESDRLLVLRGCDQPCLAEIDATQFKKVIYNFLSNAWKFTAPATGRIEVALEADHQWLHLGVEDNGQGIAPERIARIFERFHHSAAHPAGGTGLGLYIANEVVRLHDGRISVDSRPGHGSRFQVTIPRGTAALEPGAEFADDAHHEAPTETTLPGSEAQQHFRVLVVDDEADIREFIRVVLAEHYDVVLAGDGVAGLEQASRYRPDLIVVDSRMPRMNGLDMIRTLRQQPELAGTPVLFLTANSDLEARDEALHAGADDFLAKPFDERELRRRLEKLRVNLPV